MSTSRDDIVVPPIARDRMPRHVGIIMDGNGRWAKQRHMPRVFGHKQGAECVRKIVKAAGEWGIEVLTLYTFSDENWGRPAEEVGVIMNLVDSYIRSEREELDRNNVRFRTIGDLSRLRPATRDLIQETTKHLASNTGLTLNVALSYGSRMELTRACRALARSVAAGDMNAEEITPEMISARLDTAGLPDPDLIIRTSGEQRVSNFLLWQAAYAELYFTQTLWPDFDRDELAQALLWYDARERRFGLTEAQAVHKKETKPVSGSPC